MEDRRGMGGKAILGGGIGGVGLIFVLIFTLLGGDPSQLLGTDSSEPYVETEQDQELAQFVSVVLAVSTPPPGARSNSFPLPPAPRGV